MRWSRKDTHLRTVARRGAGAGLIVVALGLFLFLDWSGTQPREVIQPEGGGHAYRVTSSQSGRTELVGANEALATKPARRGAADESADEVLPPALAAKPANPLNMLVDGTGFARFLGFAAISLGFALVVLVFFWSHRRDLNS